MSDNTIEKKFQKSVEIVGSLPKEGNDRPSQEIQLEFYSLYKQATIGDVNTTRPGMLDFTGKAKWDAWKGKEGLSQDEAKSKYVELLKDHLEKSSDQNQAKRLLEQLNSA
ncbi:diazepam-binding inhibitor [Phakopsora pachyrhizi]|uniref:Diazepam-binding inhibitor n=1 Tax=Phakopsora pachyrhizi TaxID=170000 RepID=A0AAV0AD64_PHAPC|nr:diazepam-binding inhibitor [Phakopsora pachyrhizi]